MPKYYVQVTGSLDWEYKIEAHDGFEAEERAEELFNREHGRSVTWSAIDAYDAEEIEEDES